MCGDGLTPRAVKQLIALGVDTSEEAGWHHNRACESSEAGFGWSCPGQSSLLLPDYGLTRTRFDLDQLLADRAISAGRCFEPAPPSLGRCSIAPGE